LQNGNLVRLSVCFPVGGFVGDENDRGWGIFAGISVFFVIFHKFFNRITCNELKGIIVDFRLFKVGEEPQERASTDSISEESVGVFSCDPAYSPKNRDWGLARQDVAK